MNTHREKGGERERGGEEEEGRATEIQRSDTEILREKQYKYTKIGSAHAGKGGEGEEKRGLVWQHTGIGMRDR